MSSRRARNTDSVQIRLDMRVAMIAGIALAVVLVFGLAFAIGRLTSRPATTAQVPGAPAPVAPGAAAPGGSSQASSQQTHQLGGSPQDTPVPVPASRAPAGEETAIGNNPRLAIPELKSSKYIYDFGEISPSQKVDKTFVLKNEGTKLLEIGEVKST